MEFLRRAIFAVTAGVFVLFSGTADAAVPETKTPEPNAVPVLAPKTVEQKLEKFRNDLVKNFTEKNLDGLLALCEPDVVVTWQDATIVKGVDELRKYHQEKMSGPNSPVDKIEFAPSIVSRQINGDTVISHGHMGDTFTLKRFSSALRFNSVFTAVLVDKGEEMKLRAAHVSLDAFDNAVLKAQGKGANLTAGITAMVALLVGVFLGRRIKS